MKQQHQVDVLVVGLGPAGSVAATEAARAGLSVMAIDRKQQVGVPVQCAEYIPLPIGQYAQAAGVLQQAISGMTSRLPSGAKTQSALPGLMIDRTAFDQALAQQAADHGVEVCCEARLVQVDAQQQLAEVKTPSTEMCVHYRLLIAADGPHSSVAASLQLAPLDSVFTRQYTVPLLQPLTDTQVWLSGDFPGGYAWLFPKGSVANLGAGADKRWTHDIKQPLESLHQELVAQGWVGREVLKLTGGLIPVGGLRPSLHIDHILFAGDAAGLTDPITGAGIAAALASGELAGAAAARYLLRQQADALTEYEQEIRERYTPSLQRALQRRAQFEAAGGKLLGDAQYRQTWIAYPEYFQTQAASA